MTRVYVLDTGMAGYPVRLAKILSCPELALPSQQPAAGSQDQDP